VALQKIALVKFINSFLKNNILSFLDDTINSKEEQQIVLADDIKSGAYKFGHCCAALKALSSNKEELVSVILSM
jgi:hypothetical protein